MSGKQVCLAGLVVLLLGLGTAHGQYSPAPPGPPTAPGMPPAYPGVPAPQGVPQVNVAPPIGVSPTTPGASAGAGGGAAGYVDLSGNNPDQPLGTDANARKPMSQWLLYPRMPGCCGPVGLNGPLGYEVYLRNGISFPIGGGLLQQSLVDGWYIEGGGRTLFYNPEMDRAWAVTLGVGNLVAHGRQNVPTFQMNNIPVHTTVPTSLPPGTSSAVAAAAAAAAGQPITVTVPSLTASVSAYNQTWVALYGGREWYLRGCADCSNPHWNWRVGLDVGGRWATEKVGFNEIRHRTGTAGGVSVAGYSEVVVPCQCVIYTFGLRTQYDYIFTDILQSQNVNDLQLFTLMVTAGLRF